MSLTLQTAMNTARVILQDNEPGDYRNSDAELLQFANDALDVATTIVPQYFYAWGDIECNPGETLQVASFIDAKVIGDVVRIKNGAALRQFDRAAMDAFNPTWHQDTAAAATQWCRSADDPVRFWIYPKAPAAQELQVQYVKVPSEYLASDAIDLPATMAPAIADYIVYMVSSQDDEHILSQRAPVFYQSFVSKLKGA